MLNRMCVAHERQTRHSKHLIWKKKEREKRKLNFFFCIFSKRFYWNWSLSDNIPENMLATAAIKKLRTTPGPAIFLATIPATRYIPVPQHDPTPSDVKSNVVRHFFETKKKILISLKMFNCLDNNRKFTVNLGFVLRGSSPWTERRSFVRTNFENNVRPVPPPGIGNESFIVGDFFLLGSVLCIRSLIETEQGKKNKYKCNYKMF